MKQKLLLIELSIKVGFMIAQDFFKYSMMEIADKTLFPMENYATCLERATAIFTKVIERALNFYALAIAEHRMCSHGDNVITEMKELSTVLTVNETKAASRGWWMG